MEAPYYALHPPARVQSRFEFVELGRDMSSNCTGEVQAGTGISGRYQLSSYHALYKYENIGYGEVPDDRLYNTYEYEFMNVVAFSYSVVCSTAPARELVYSSTWYQV